MKKTKRILFAFWPLAVEYNFAISLLSAICKKRGIETQLIVLGEMSDFVHRVLSEPADYVGFSCVTKHDYLLCVPFMKMAQSLGKKVLAGGVFLRRYCPPNIPADFVCRGEGETLADYILKGDDQLFTERMHLEHLNDLPWRDHELFADYPYKREIPLFDGNKVLPFHTSRGCPFNCTFCEVKHQTNGIRVREHFIDEMDCLAELYKPDLFHIGDELLPYYNKIWMAEFQRNTHPFIAYIHASIKPDVLHQLIDLGLSGCAFGVESSDERFRNRTFKKGLSDKRLFETVKILEARNVMYTAFYIHGYQDQPDSKEDLIAFSSRIGGHPMYWQYEHLEVN